MAENEQIEKLQVFRETTPNGLVLMVSIFSEKKNASHNPNHRLLLIVTGLPAKLKNSNPGHPTPKSPNTSHPATRFPVKTNVFNPGKFLLKFLASTLSTSFPLRYSDERRFNLGKLSREVM
mmetsp:Transcript_27177/g.57176  ORF Transcript_27177/g.57176 Transcript_27177/m.57176 type:complete len:121 (+) Transcript_27177:365-727(+)